MCKAIEVKEINTNALTLILFSFISIAKKGMIARAYFLHSNNLNFINIIAQ